MAGPNLDYARASLYLAQARPPTAGSVLIPLVHALMYVRVNHLLSWRTHHLHLAPAPLGHRSDISGLESPAPEQAQCRAVGLLGSDYVESYVLRHQREVRIMVDEL